MNYRRAHPLHMIKSTSGYIALLIFPVLRALFYSGGDLFTWLSGAWFDIFVLFIIIGLGFINWYFDMFDISSEGLHVFKGIINIKKQFLPYNNISSIIIEKPFYLIAIRAVKVKVDTDSGSVKDVDLSFVMHKRDAEDLLYQAENKLVYKQHGVGRVYSPRILYIAILSIISSNSLTGVLLVSTFISQSGNLLGKEFEQTLVTNLTNLARIMAFGVPPVAAAIAYALIGGWAIAFIVNISRNKDFSVTRRDDGLILRAGVFTTRNYLLNIQRINLVEIRQTLVTKILGFYSVYINCAGYGKLKRSTSVLIPAAERNEALDNLKLLLPEIRFVKRDIKPSGKDFTRFISIPFGFIAALALLIVMAKYIFPNFGVLILFVGLMLEIIPVIYLIVGIIGYTHTGIGMSNDMITASFTKMLTFRRISLPIRKLSSVEFHQNIFQRSTNCCNVIFYVYSEGKQKYIIRNLNRDKVSEFILPKLK